MMFGYSDDVKGYRLYDFEVKKVIYSKDVVFNEVVNSDKSVGVIRQITVENLF